MLTREQIYPAAPVSRILTILGLLLLVILPTQASAPLPLPTDGEAHLSQGADIPLPRVACIGGYTASIYAQGLISPDGLAIAPDGSLYVVEEMPGRVSRIAPDGRPVPVLSDLRRPEGITFDEAGNLYVIEDIEDGRLLMRDTAGITHTLATGLEAPEGVVCGADGTLYVSESNAQYVANPLELHTRISAISPLGDVTPIITTTPIIQGSQVFYWSYAGLTLGADGWLYISNELTGQQITKTVPIVPGIITATVTLSSSESLFALDPATGSIRTVARGLIAAEGLYFSAGGRFPLYVAERDIGNGVGRLSRVAADGSRTTLCTGLATLEDVVVDRLGALYISEEGSGMILRLTPNRGMALPLILATVSR